MDKLLTEVTDAATQAWAERLDYELKGAYRAGYDYVHVFDGMPEMGFKISFYILPSNHEEPPFHTWEDVTYMKTYDLREQHLNEKARRGLQA